MTTEVRNDRMGDPIVDEVRRAGAVMAREANYDLHTLCERLREAERRHPERVLVTALKAP